MTPHHVLLDIMVIKHAPVHVKLMAHGVVGHSGIKASVHHMTVHQAKQKMTPHHVLRDIMVIKHARVPVKLMAHGVDGHHGIKANVHLMTVHQVTLKMM